MKKHIIYTLVLLVFAFVACKPSPKTDTTAVDAENTAVDMEAIHNRCIDSVKARINNVNKVMGYTLDTIAIVAIDTATEKMAQQYYCGLLYNVKTATDNYVELQKNTVDAARKVHPSLGAQEQATLKGVLEKQKIADAEWEACNTNVNTFDSIHYTYTRIKTLCIRTTPKGKDTVKTPYFIGKDFVVKTY